MLNNYNKVKEKYIKAGFKDFKIKKIEDIEKIHGVNIKNLKNITQLSDEDKSVVENFIINWYNTIGLLKRESVTPTKVIKQDDYLIFCYIHDQKEEWLHIYKEGAEWY